LFCFVICIGISVKLLPEDLVLFYDQQEQHNQQHNDHQIDSSIKDDYFLTEDELKLQVESLHNFITAQMQQIVPSSHTKINTTALGFPDLGAFRQIFSGFGDTIKRDAVCNGCQVFMGVMVHQVRAYFL
jgi:hypothetical protein